MKKSIIFLWIALLPCLLFSQNKVETLRLDEGWQFSQTGKNQWYDAEVPGSVQRDLIRHGVLPDPYFGTNENVVQWPEKEDWDFKKSFMLSEEQLNHDDALLFFEGLDTHADVFLNGSRILQSQNMFVGHKISVKNLLRKGENNLYIRFFSPITRMLPAAATAGFDYPADNDHGTPKLSVYSRKAPYQFGWDWGMRLVQMGIWKPITLTFYDKARIDDFFVKQTSVTKEKAIIDNQIEIYSVEPQPVDASIAIEYGLKGESQKTVSKNIVLNPGKNVVSIPLQIDNPKRWMPVNWGKPYLYDFKAKLSFGNQTIAEKIESVGLRKVQLIQKDDEIGKSFYFEVNDIPLFAKGANYIPGEILRTQQDTAYYQRLFDNITSANMNFVRVWGGGTYEDDYFYRLADEKGILVWQDFIFGCTPYPSDDVFLQNVREEVIYNVKRLRNHASLAFWCGNNEIEEGLRYWGWDKRNTPETMELWKKGYDKTFRTLIPDLLSQYDGTRSYIHGSPYNSSWGKIESFKSSDVHDWGLWHGRMPFEAMADRLPRFASEFGFQSFPEMKTIRTFATEKDFDINSDVMKIHQKSGVGNVIIKQYMDMYFHEPKNFEDFVYLGLVMQGNGMEEAVEANRRGRPYCMGALYWQINDDWPVVSWSSIDYYNNWKAQHYRMRDVFAPLALGVKFADNKLNYYTMSDYLNDIDNLKLTIQVIDFSKGVVRELKEKVNAKANSSQVVKSIDVLSLISESDKANTVIRAGLSDDKGKTISTKDYFFYWPNKLNLPETKVNTKITYADGKYTVTLTSPKLAKDVFIEIPVLGARFSDNFIDLMPGEKRVIEITSPQLKASEKTPITIRHIRETY